MAILVEIIDAESGDIDEHKLFEENKLDFQEVRKYVYFHDAIGIDGKSPLFNVYVMGQCGCGKHEHHKAQIVSRGSWFFTQGIINELWMTANVFCYNNTEGLADELVDTLENYDDGFILEYVNKTGEIPIRDILSERAVIDFRCAFLNEEVVASLYEAGFVNVLGYYIKPYRKWKKEWQ